MSGKASIAAGLAIASPVLQNFSNSLLIEASICVIIGSLMPDIDIRNSKIRSLFKKPIILLICTYIIYVLYKRNINNNIFYIYSFMLLITSIFSFLSKHRSFSHSLLALICFSIPLKYFIGITLVSAFAIGYLTHLFLDCFSTKGIQLLFPKRNKICFKIRHTKSIDYLTTLVCYVIFIINVILPKV